MLSFGFLFPLRLFSIQYTHWLLRREKSKLDTCFLCCMTNAFPFFSPILIKVAHRDFFFQLFLVAQPDTPKSLAVYKSPSCFPMHKCGMCLQMQTHNQSTHYTEACVHLLSVCKFADVRMRRCSNREFECVQQC